MIDFLILYTSVPLSFCSLKPTQHFYTEVDDNKTIIFWQAFIEIHQNLVPAKWDYINRPEPLSLSMHVALASQVALLSRPTVFVFINYV